MKNFLSRFMQWIILHFKTYIWLGTFRCNCIWGQLNNEGGGELHEKKKKSRQNENTQRNNMIKSKQISFGVTCTNVFILKCVLIMNISIEHYMEGVIR